MAIAHETKVVKYHDPRLSTGNPVTKNQTIIHTRSKTIYRHLYFLRDFLNNNAEATIKPKKNARINTG